MTYTNTDTGEIIGTAASQTAAAIWESLEQRQMMSAAAGVTFVDGVLILRGNSAAGNDLAVNVSDDGQSIWGVANNQSGEHIDIGKVRQIRIIGGEEAEVLFAGSQGGFVGLDQINVHVPRSLIGRGEVDLVLIVDGLPANTMKLNVR